MVAIVIALMVVGSLVIIAGILVMLLSPVVSALLARRAGTAAGPRPQVRPRSVGGR
ncbi:hypothetical protein SOM11_02820 [Frigoribacterium sp. CFBP9039]|uniref:hypothetical protein n=1 Tax=unclassified Frigoribacterium TaxID=2627005 RepID=UPI002A69915B|nr:MULTISPECIES: hypothetical protein [unclassified Frigoribacterium]MDY0892948.1 hypothetical protein [Frigoribacterium sp. CFBP9030]MDY0944912.1 hypothetical protein [Frigoribacterium sp. CFBP9039]